MSTGGENMNQIEFLNQLKLEIKFSTFDKIMQQNIESFLIGESDTLNAGKRKNRIYTSFFSVMERELDSDYSEMVKRAFKLMFYIYPSESFYYFRSQQNHYEIYYKVGLSPELVKEDIIQNICSVVEYYGNGFEENITAFLTEHKIGKEKKNGWSFMFQHFGEIVNEIAFQNTKVPKEQMAGFVLSIMGMEFYKEDEEKSLLFQQNAENTVLAVVNQLYKVDLIQEKLNKFFDNEDLKLFLNYPQKTSLFYNPQLIEKVLIAICRLFHNSSTLIDKAYKICLIQNNDVDYLQKFDQNEDVLIKLYRKYELPYTFDLNIYSGLMLEKGFQKQGPKYFDRLSELLQNQKSAFLDAYESYKKNCQLNYVVLMAVLLKNNQKLISTDVEEAENCILKNFKGLLNQDAKGDGSFEFVYNEIRNHDPFVIKDIDFAIEKASMNCQAYGKQYGKIVTASAILFEQSDTAKVIASLFISTVSERREGSNLNVFRTAFQIFSNRSGKDCYELLSEMVGAEKVIGSYLNYEEAYKDIGAFRQFLKKYDQATISYLRRMIEKNTDFITYFIEIVYGEELGFDYEEILPVFENKSKTVVDYMEHFFAERPECRSLVEKLLQTKNKNTKLAISRLIKLWDSEKTANEMMKITTADEMSDYILNRYEKGSEKLIPFLNEIDFGSVRFINSDQRAPKNVIIYYISEYMLLKEPRNILECSFLRKFLNKGDLRRLTQSIFSLWLEKGAEAKQKNLLLAYALNCNEEDITNLKKQIDLWTENSRGALASFAVTAMAMNGSDIALMLTDNIAAKYKNKQVRSEAQKAMERAATDLGISTDDLADKIIPNLGFDIKREKWLDYGQRRFKVYLNQKMEATLFDETGKQIKALPKATASDNQELAEEAKEELKGLKKQLKAIISTQKNRLETAVVTGRKWTKDKWTKLFVENPIMNCFATGLIWEEIDEEGKLIDTFRYMEDGSFNTSEEEEYELGPNAIIMLFHSMDADQSLADTWQSQLEDYEVVQPIKQLSMPVYTLMEAEKEQQEITRFLGTKVYFGTIRSVMEKYGWRRTSILDAGGYEGYYFEQEELEVGVQLTFDFIYVGMMADDTADMNKLVFYKKGSVDYGSYCYDEVKSDNRVMPENVPPKLASFALMVADSIAQKSI